MDTALEEAQKQLSAQIADLTCRIADEILSTVNEVDAPNVKPLYIEGENEPKVDH